MHSAGSKTARLLPMTNCVSNFRASILQNSEWGTNEIYQRGSCGWRMKYDDGG